MLISVTRLRLRSIRFIVPFAYRTSQSRKQALTTPGCLDVRTRKTRGLTFWTLSLWDDEKSLRTFLAGGPHRSAMPRLAKWCDEAAVAHWDSTARELPTWESAAARLREIGRPSRVVHPSNMQRGGGINAD
jgi:Domain of unknown function (DUF3291)